jgi:outer membrane biogenesis lipoprotein LolB
MKQAILFSILVIVLVLLPACASNEQAAAQEA